MFAEATIKPTVQAAEIPRYILIDCRSGASDGADAAPGLIVLRRSMRGRMIGGVR
jgi:hypothetical protein